MAVIFDGRKFAKEKTEELMGVMGGLRGVGETPKMVAIMVGESPESELYLRLKEKKAKEIGVEFVFKKFSGENPQEIIDYIQEKNNDPSVEGIMAEIPLPRELDKYDILDKIRPDKDVDCLTSENLKLLEEGRPRFVPPTVKAVGEILKMEVGSGKLEAGTRVVMVGSEGMVGKGILSYLRNLSHFSNLRGIDKETTDLASVTKEADVLISATGVGHLIKKEMVKPGAIVIDVGIERQSDGSLIGDVDFENVKERASFITPVPGGVGPVTIVCLMENLLQTC